MFTKNNDVKGTSNHFQILGQINNAYKCATLGGRCLIRIFCHAFFTKTIYLSIESRVSKPIEIMKLIVMADL